MHNTATSIPHAPQRIFALAEFNGLSEEVSQLICQAAEGQAGAKAELEAQHHITIDDLCDGDFEIVQRYVFTLGAYN